MTTPSVQSQKVMHVNIFQALFLKIAEPRVIRLMLFGVYVLSFWAGVAMLINLPSQFVRVLGDNLVFTFGVFIILGSFASALAVLPGIWWLERVGIILLMTSVFIYAIILSFLDASPVAVAFILGLALCFAVRWVEIKGAQLAPRED